jgi:DNA-binding response OmpR family regulator
MSGNGRVMVLEDEPILGFALEDMLETIGGWEVSLIARLEEAEVYLDGTSPDLAILDVNIHGRLSYGIADRLQGAGIPYFFATGYGDRTHPQAHQAVPTVTKPYTMDDIRGAIAQVAGRGPGAGAA